MCSLAVLLLFASVAAAQHTSPYVGEEQRPIKSLSEQEVADLREGNGMGFAKPAELNGYPGPKHVLELAEKLALTAEQRQKIEAEFTSMKAESRELGSQVIAAELELEKLFAAAQASELEVSLASMKAAELRGKLRAAHLKAHITTTRLLTAEQAQQYKRLRGYADGHQHR
jgi:Spy/CpxP family protein refolding chaperone